MKTETEHYIRKTVLLTAASIAILLGFRTYFEAGIVENPLTSLALIGIWIGSIMVLMYALTDYGGLEKVELASFMILMLATSAFSAVFISSSAPPQDSMIFLEQASEAVVEGENPYTVKMRPGSITSGDIYWTPRRDGSIVNRFSYPAMSVIPYIPLQKAGINIRWLGVLLIPPLFLTFLLFTPEEFGLLPILPLPLLPFYVRNLYLGADLLWIVPLALSVLLWERNRDYSAVFFGIACAVKQFPWLIAPFLVIRLLAEDESWRKGLKKAARFGGIASAVFLLPNLPFMAGAPVVWLDNVVRLPLLSLGVGSPESFMGQGLAILSFSGAIEAGRWVYTAAMAVVSLGFTALLLKRPERVKHTVWIVPALIMFFNYRGLIKYYLVFIPVALSAIIAKYRLENDIEGLRKLDEILGI